MNIVKYDFDFARQSFYFWLRQARLSLLWRGEGRLWYSAFLAWRWAETREHALTFHHVIMDAKEALWKR